MKKISNLQGISGGKSKIALAIIIGCTVLAIPTFLLAKQAEKADALNKELTAKLGNNDCLQKILSSLEEMKLSIAELKIQQQA